MDKERQQAIEALEIKSEPDRSVKCQKCGRWVRMLDNPYQPKSDRRQRLQNMIRIIEKQKESGANISESKEAALKSLKEELAEMLEGYKKHDFMPRIPLHHWKGKMICINCIPS